MKSKSLWRLLALLLSLAMVAAACGSDDEGDESGDGTTEESTDGDTVELTQGGGTLAAVRDRGTLNCGGNDTLPGFGIVDDAGEFSGFDIDFCRVVAAAVLGDANAVEFIPLTAEARFTALQSGEIDVLVRNTTWTASRDGVEGATFLQPNFYD